jgi:PAS domain S-box-containing protein
LHATEPNTTYEEAISYLHPEDRPATEDAITRCVETRGDYDSIYRVVWPDKSVHWLRCKGRFLTGAPTRLVGVAVDVTWLKQSEEAHFQAEQHLRKVNEELEGRVAERTADLQRTTAKVVEQARLLDLANDAIFVRGADDRVSYWNQGAERLYGWTAKEAIGQSTHDLLRTEFPIPVSEVLNSDHWEGELKHTKRDGTKIIVASRWTTLRDRERKLVGWLEINTDISIWKTVQHAAAKLSSRLLRVQDEERRRIGRELHDSLGQSLAIVKMNLDLLSTYGDDPQSQQEKAQCLSESLKAVDQCLTETRTLSHLLHPPLLDEAGFPSAARWYVDGFAKRGGLKVASHIPQDLPRLQSNTELALFRALQESLSNVYRHSGSSAVSVTIQSDDKQVTLQVKDNGSGISEARMKQLRECSGEVGVGLAGMRERVRDLGGRLDLDSSSEGTTVTVVVPRAQSDTNDKSRSAA